MRIRRHHTPAVRPVLIGACSNKDDEIGFVHDRLRQPSEGTGADQGPKNTGREGMGFIDGSLSHVCGEDRKVSSFLESGQCGSSGA